MGRIGRTSGLTCVVPAQPLAACESIFLLGLPLGLETPDMVQFFFSFFLQSFCLLACPVHPIKAWTLCRDNRAPAGGRGVVFVGGPGGGPNSAAYARPQYGARRSGGPSGPGTMQAQIQENIGRHAERAPEGPPQVNTHMQPTCTSCYCIGCLSCCFGVISQSCTSIMTRPRLLA